MEVLNTCTGTLISLVYLSYPVFRDSHLVCLTSPSFFCYLLVLNTLKCVLVSEQVSEWASVSMCIRVWGGGEEGERERERERERESLPVCTCVMASHFCVCVCVCVCVCISLIFSKVISPFIQSSSFTSLMRRKRWTLLYLLSLGPVTCLRNVAWLTRLTQTGWWQIKAGYGRSSLIPLLKAFFSFLGSHL